VLTSDFLVDFDDQSRPAIAFQAKYSADLAKPEVIERLELERQYWAEKNIPWYIVTEMDFAKTAFNNIQWLYPVQTEDAVAADDLERYLELFSKEFMQAPDRQITAVAQSLDMVYELEPGQALYWLRQLLARRYFIFDITALTGPCGEASSHSTTTGKESPKPMLPVNQVFRVGDKHFRLLWCDAETAFWIDLEDKTAWPVPIATSELENMLLDGAVEPAEDPFLDSTLREIEEGSSEWEKRESAWEMLRGEVGDVGLFFRKGEGQPLSE
jgi:hypothetical protein